MPRFPIRYKYLSDYIVRHLRKLVSVVVLRRMIWFTSTSIAFEVPNAAPFFIKYRIPAGDIDACVKNKRIVFELAKMPTPDDDHLQKEHEALVPGCFPFSPPLIRWSIPYFAFESRPVDSEQHYRGKWHKKIFLTCAIPRIKFIFEISILNNYLK